MEKIMIDMDEISPFDGKHFLNSEDWKEQEYKEHRQGIAFVKKGIKEGKKITPIAVRECKTVSDKKYERVDGFKRYIAYKELRLKKIPCFLYTKEDGPMVTPGMQYGLPVFEEEGEKE